MNRIDWSKKLLSSLKYAPTTGNLLALVAWQSAENTKAKWNPLATTQSWPGATNFNTTGVKNYKTATDGIAATTKTLQNGKYPNILAALKAGTSGRAVVQAIGDSPWGTGSLAAKKYDEILAKYNSLGSVIVSS